MVIFSIGDRVFYKGVARTVFDVDEGYGYLALDGDKYITPDHEENRCISAPMTECELILY